MAKLLLVEDEVDLRDAMAEEIAEEGYEIQVAQNGLTALEALAKYTPDIIVSDINMPEMDGFELLENIRKNCAHLDDVPFIFLSAFNAKDDVIKGKKLGADDYLVKPVDFDLLFATLESRLSQVQRMIERKEKQFVKLYNTLQTEHQKQNEEAVAVAAAEAKAQVEADHQIHADAQVDEAPAESEEDEVGPDEVRVFGRCINFEGMLSVFKRFNKDKHLNLETFLMSALESSISEDVEVDTSVPGMFFLYGTDTNNEIIASDGLELELSLQKKVFANPIGDVITSNFSMLVLGKDLRVRCLPFNTTVPIELEDQKVERTKFLLQKLRDMFSDKGFVQKEMQKIHAKSLLFESEFSRADDKLPAMRFFYFDEQSKDQMATAKGFCSGANQKAIDFMKDMLFLELLHDKVAEGNPESILVIDVHYDTLAKPEKLAQYRKRYESIFEGTAYKVYLCVRGIPHNLDHGKCASVILSVPLNTIGWIAQFNPWLDTGMEVDKMSVPCVVWGMADIFGTSAGLEHYKKQRSAYKLCGSKLILRDVPGDMDVSAFSGFSLSGYSINKR